MISSTVADFVSFFYKNDTQVLGKKHPNASSAEPKNKQPNSQLARTNENGYLQVFRK